MVDKITGTPGDPGIQYVPGGNELKVDYAFREINYFESNPVFAVAIVF
jgi:hypothetical protein